MAKCLYADRCREGDLTLTKREGEWACFFSKMFSFKILMRISLPPKARFFVSGIGFFADAFEHDYLNLTGDPRAENTLI